MAIRPLDGMLCIETMRYADEVLPRDELVPDEDVELTQRERTMAQQLIDSLASEHFEPERYRDEFREQLLGLIERKAAGEEVVTEPVVEAPAKVLDLVAALEASLAKAESAKERHPSAAARAVGEDTPAPKPAKRAAKAAKVPAKKAARSERSA